MTSRRTVEADDGSISSHTHVQCYNIYFYAVGQSTDIENNKDHCSGVTESKWIKIGGLLKSNGALQHV